MSSNLVDDAKLVPWNMILRRRNQEIIDFLTSDDMSVFNR